MKSFYQHTMWFLLAFQASFALTASTPTPPMGWNSWNTFQGNINEAKIKQVVDSMISKGMRDAGYIFVNLDDNWMANPARDGQGNIKADPTRFPNGIKGLADYVHSKGMKLGVYSDRGSMTCMDIPQSGGYGNEAKDAQTYASWGVDYLKYDNCNTIGDMKTDYTNMANALAATDRAIVYSICAWTTKDWMPNIGNLWRSTTDIKPYWVPAPNSTLNWSIMTNLDGNAGNFIFTRPGAWADPDMLEVGNGHLSLEEYKSHFGLWALMAAPLIAGNDVRNMTSEIRDLLTHSEAIAIDQDPAGVQGRRIRVDGNYEVWAKPLGKGYSDWAIGLLNRSGATANISIRWQEIYLDPVGVTVRDVWQKKDLGTFNDSFSVAVPSHGLAFLRVHGDQVAGSGVWASDLHITSVENGWNFLHVDQSIDGGVLTLGGKTYSKGLGTHAPSSTTVRLHGKFERFQADVGIDDEVNGGSVVFQIFGDGQKIYESPVCKGSDAPVSIDISVAGMDSLQLVVTDGGDGNDFDHADWAGALLMVSSPVPQQPFADTLAIPGLIEAEHFDLGGEGKAYHDEDLKNSGGLYRETGVDIGGDSTTGDYVVGWTAGGEWLEYTVKVQRDGIYHWQISVASGSDGGKFHLSLDETLITDTINVPNTGAWETYEVVQGVTTALTAGVHVLRLNIDHASFNIDHLKFLDDPLPLKPKSVLTNGPKTYQIYNITGAYLGTIHVENEASASQALQHRVSRSGIYLLKSSQATALQVQVLR